MTMEIRLNSVLYEGDFLKYFTTEDDFTIRIFYGNGETQVYTGGLIEAKLLKEALEDFINSNDINSKSEIEFNNLIAARFLEIGDTVEFDNVKSKIIKVDTYDLGDNYGVILQLEDGRVFQLEEYQKITYHC